MWKTPLSQETQLENLKAHYGFSLNFVEVTIPLTMNEMIDIFGEKCNEFESRCPICKAWEQWSSGTHKATVVVSRDSIVKAAKED